MLPEQALCKLAGLNALDFQRREPTDIAAYIFGKAGEVAADNIHKGRHALTRRLAYMETRDLCFDDLFGTLPEVDLYGFLLTCTTPRCSTALTAGLALPLSGASSTA